MTSRHHNRAILRSWIPRALLVACCLLVAVPGFAGPPKQADAAMTSPISVVSKLVSNAITLSLGGMLVGDRERFLDKATRTMPLVADAPARIAGASAAISSFFSSLLDHE